MAEQNYGEPVICARCHSITRKKIGAKTPKYCPSCRADLQSEFKEKLNEIRQAKIIKPEEN